MVRNPSGEQWEIVHGAQRVVVVEVGGGLRDYLVGDTPVLAGYAQDEQAVSGRGQLLMPWPNRIRDGQYSFGGHDLQLALTEPGRHNAIHGLVRWALWSLLEHSPSSVTVGYRLHPQQGWSWHLDLTVSYALSEAGLSVTTTVHNPGTAAAPFGYGAHPFVALGGSDPGALTLRVPAASVVEVDPERLLPTGRSPVSGDVDFRQPRPLADTALDTAFGDVERDPDGCWRLELGRAQDTVTLWADEAFDWIQVFTGTSRGELGGVPGVAVEPMTCPPEAFRSGEGLITIEPGGQWSGQWGLSVGPAGRQEG